MQEDARGYLSPHSEEARMTYCVKVCDILCRDLKP